MASPNFTQMFAPQDVNEGPLNGFSVGIKDLFDVKGYTTRAGSRTREALPPATEDSAAVARLRDAGAQLVGHTNMTEFAYSGLGLNPHYGTPLTPLFAGAIAGGSTSGGAAAIAEGEIDIALGTDTGGSSRIPAAFCGLVGFKPTAANISRKGVVPLSHSLDSVGVLAKDVRTVKQVFTILSDVTEAAAPRTIQRLIIPKTLGMTDLDPAIAKAFEEAVTTLTQAGYQIAHADLDFFADYMKLPIWHFSAVESRHHHASAYENKRDLIDPRVAARMKRADEVSGIDYLNTLMLREEIVEAARHQMKDAAVLLPTVPILPPQLSAFDEPEAFDKLNLLALRNTSIANIIDGASLSLPLPTLPGAGIMLTGAHGSDLQVLALGQQIETLLS